MSEDFKEKKNFRKLKDNGKIYFTLEVCDILAVFNDQRKSNYYTVAMTIQQLIKLSRFLAINLKNNKIIFVRLGKSFNLDADTEVAITHNVINYMNGMRDYLEKSNDSTMLNEW